MALLNADMNGELRQALDSPLNPPMLGDFEAQSFVIHPQFQQRLVVYLRFEC
ncbi:MAG: hypothetical protein F6K28_48650 [Microcoleus sp. SIO2G3]|nr:hypothetical protein [Microcoleus sp. SIO2G3]